MVMVMVRLTFVQFSWYDHLSRYNIHVKSHEGWHGKIVASLMYDIVLDKLPSCIHVQKSMNCEEQKALIPF